ncbi:MAG: DUF3240 family protein [Betaproteobacteria bacterium]|nr:DUF3240 family protein [Betaproteobacteria bacterium]
MNKVLLTLVMPDELAQEIEDLLLSRADLIKGFTVSHAEGHGSAVELVEAGELVAGHVPRTVIRSVGSETAMRAVIALIKQKLPRANVYFWLVPIIDMGRI